MERREDRDQNSAKKEEAVTSMPQTRKPGGQFILSPPEIRTQLEHGAQHTREAELGQKLSRTEARAGAH